MLDLAIKHKEELKKEMIETMFLEKYKFYNPASFYSEFMIDEKNVGWNSIECVSYDKKKKKIVGYLMATINRDAGFIDGLGIINFTDDKITFGKDLREFLLKIIKREDIRKICFSASVENKINKTYEKMIKKYNGRIVGINLQHYKLFDGTYSDRVMYEIDTKEIKKVLNNRGRVL